MGPPLTADPCRSITANYRRDAVPMFRKGRMDRPRIVSSGDCIVVRKELLRKKRQFTRQRQRLAQNAAACQGSRFGVARAREPNRVSFGGSFLMSGFVITGKFGLALLAGSTSRPHRPCYPLRSRAGRAYDPSNMSAAPTWADLRRSDRPEAGTPLSKR